MTTNESLAQAILDFNEKINIAEYVPGVEEYNAICLLACAVLEGRPITPLVLKNRPFEGHCDAQGHYVTAN